MMSSDPANPYANYSGTGNTLNFGQGHVRKMVMDSLRYWKNEMHIDGFRFDLASVFSRNADGSLNWGHAPIFAEIAADPELGRLHLIAEPWDTGAYQLGRGFPGITWLQWNGRFRDDVRRFVKGDSGMVPDLMRRIYGSDDFFPDNRADAYHRLPERELPDFPRWLHPLRSRLLQPQAQLGERPEQPGRHGRQLQLELRATKATKARPPMCWPCAASR